MEAMARELIDREPIMHDLMSMDGYEKSIAGKFALQKIAGAPKIDAVEVVRCEKCVNWDTDWQPERGQEGDHYCKMLCDATAPGFYCGFGELKQEEACVAHDEALWLIVKEAGFHDGVLYTTPMIACSECGVAALHEQSGGMGHGGPQISCRWLATQYCPNCGKKMKNWRIKYETESSGGGMPE